MIKIILWDIDGTILNFLAAEKAAIRRCFEIFGLGKCTDEMISEYSSINVKYWEKLERGELTKPEILVGRFREFFRHYNIDTSVAEAFNSEYQIRLGDTICFFDGATEVLEHYKGRLLQCAVTNGTRVAQERKLKESGLDRVFDYIFISEDVGFEKPNQKYFEKVTETLPPCRKDEIIIIGDSLTSDIKGGREFGIRTCWFNPAGKNGGPGLYDFEIQSLSQVTEIIGKFNS